MLQHLPHWLGEAMRTVRAGSDRLTLATLGTASELPTLELTSPAFADGDPIPVRFTADGAGISPPLAWGPEPETTRSLVLMVEDADAPTPVPLVHALLFDIAPGTRHIAEGAIGGHAGGEAEAGETGRNSLSALRLAAARSAERAWRPPLCVPVVRARHADRPDRPSRPIGADGGDDGACRRGGNAHRDL